MTPDEIIEAYNVLAQDVQDNTAQEAARIGNAQRSLGTLAERVASPSGQTNGLANYTYDRVMRPTINATAKSLAVQGLASGLETNLSNALRAAKNRYEDAKNRALTSSGGGGGNGGGNNGNGNGSNEITDPAYTGVPLTDENYTVRDFLNQQHERGEISDEDYEAAINALVGGDGGSYKPSSSRGTFEGDSYLVKRMGNEYHWGTVTENEYRNYLRNQGFGENDINARVNFYRGKGSL